MAKELFRCLWCLLPDTFKEKVQKSSRKDASREVLYLGKRDVESEFGADTTKEAISSLWSDGKPNLKELRISFTWLGLHMEDLETNRVRVYPIERISYAIVDSVFDRVLSVIIKTNDLLECYCFLFSKPSEAKGMLRNFEKSLTDAANLYLSKAFENDGKLGFENLAYDDQTVNYNNFSSSASYDSRSRANTN
ncbi:hypothetical protein TrispH2_005951 [Trichoplax sp. H2]|uniref:PID domain-containing protein n=1 Tax=Trichoplax adhaerens TaxID=10228 RepID=B3S4F6_TRIAD|nr:hypothetical protein TRIADDRAFT_59066 [Trichoplax adhaerens]EDV22454.1 hypothetical protein TRIADDRAFT_59066 [Trichoplax adhaerens]RDD41088.1 hypothetical protein TrispH2_005951 [Trichoplax sp. H2]|eukprot:XP_002114998.1 hypothetical protein TRIADDRAFT_59066 [Trichoplax adhaerens]